MKRHIKNDEQIQFKFDHNFVVVVVVVSVVRCYLFGVDCLNNSNNFMFGVCIHIAETTRCTFISIVCLNS